MAGKRLELSSTGHAVAENVERLVRSSGLTYTQLSARLAGAGRDIPPLAVGRIVKKERRVDSDDLVALAIALGVTPITLLMPACESESDQVVIPTGVEVTAGMLWDWLRAHHSIPMVFGAYLEFVNRALPPWERAKLEQRWMDTDARAIAEELVPDPQVRAMLRGETLGDDR